MWKNQTKRTQNQVLSKSKWCFECTDILYSDILDVNEVAIANIEHDLKQTETKLYIKIRDTEQKLDKLIEEKQQAWNSNYGELNVFYQTLHDEIEDLKTDIKKHNFQLWKDIKNGL